VRFCQWDRWFWRCWPRHSRDRVFERFTSMADLDVPNRGAESTSAVLRYRGPNLLHLSSRCLLALPGSACSLALILSASIDWCARMLGHGRSAALTLNSVALAVFSLPPRHYRTDFLIPPLSQQQAVLCACVVTAEPCVRPGVLLAWEAAS